MPLCTCKQCLISTNGQGKICHRTTIKRHMKREQMDQELEDEYQNLHPEEDDDLYEESESLPMEEGSAEEQNLDNEEESPMENEEGSPMETSEEQNLDNEEETPRENPFDFSDNEAHMGILSDFDDDDYCESQSESEFDEFADKEGEEFDEPEGEFQKCLIK